MGENSTAGEAHTLSDEEAEKAFWVLGRQAPTLKEFLLERACVQLCPRMAVRMLRRHGEEKTLLLAKLTSSMHMAEAFGEDHPSARLYVENWMED